MSNLPSGTVTLLLSDIEGSTRLLQRLGADYAGALGQHRILMRQACLDHGGVPVDATGDGFLAAFSRAAQAVAASAQAQRALAEHAWPQNASLRVRIGLHTGQPEVAGNDYVGLDVHQTARIMSAAHGGQVLASQSTRDACQHNLPPNTSLRSLGLHRLKDLDESLALFQVEIDGLPQQFPPLRTLGTGATLPASTTSLVGREPDIAHCCALLRRADVRLLCLSGPGGSGKTRLALALAGEMRGDFEHVAWVALAPTRDEALVASAIAAGVGLPDSGGADAVAALIEWAHGRSLLLAIDNFEQVTGAAPLLSGLLHASPRLKILVTSRTVLHLSGEHEYIVPPLALPPDQAARPADLGRSLSREEALLYPAVALFAQCAQAAHAGFALTDENAWEVAQICARLDGLPLAIELAAARSRVLSPSAVLARLGNRLALLTGGPSDVDARQQTLSNAIAWSYDLLSKPEHILFRRLSAFTSGCTLEAAHAVGLDSGEEEPMETLDALSSLVDKSLLQLDARSASEAEAGASEIPARFWMLETIREFAARRLEESGEGEAVRRRHALFFRALCESERPNALAAESRRRLSSHRRLTHERPNMRQAIAWSLEHDITLALELIEAADYWADNPSESQRFAEQALERASPTSSQQAAPNTSEVPPRLLSSVLGVAARGAWRRGDYARGHELAARRLELMLRSQDDLEIAWALFHMGDCALGQGDPRADGLFAQALEMFGSLGALGPDARQFSAWTLDKRGDCALDRGDLEVAEEFYRQSGELFALNGDRDGVASSLAQRAEVARARGELEESRRLFEQCEGIERELSDARPHAWRRLQRGRLETERGDFAQASRLLRQATRAFAETSEHPGLARTLLALAFLAEAQSQWHRAALLLGVEESLRRARGLHLPPSFARDHARVLSQAQAALSHDECQFVLSQGRALDLAHALALADEA